MGEYAEMMLDGTCCCSCGEYLGDGDGYPGYCADCQPEETVKVRAPKVKQTKSIPCSHKGCNRKFSDNNALKQHLHQAHVVMPARLKARGGV
jgi:hypothetical protein